MGLNVNYSVTDYIIGYTEYVLKVRSLYIVCTCYIILLGQITHNATAVVQ